MIEGQEKENSFPKALKFLRDLPKTNLVVGCLWLQRGPGRTGAPPFFADFERASLAFEGGAHFDNVPSLENFVLFIFGIATFNLIRLNFRRHSSSIFYEKNPILRCCVRFGTGLVRNLGGNAKSHKAYCDW